MVGVFATDDEILARLAQQITVTMDEAQVGVVGRGPRVGEEHMVKLGGGNLHQRTCQFDSGLGA